MSYRFFEHGGKVVTWGCCSSRVPLALTTLKNMPFICELRSGTFCDSFKYLAPSMLSLSVYFQSSVSLGRPANWRTSRKTLFLELIFALAITTLRFLVYEVAVTSFMILWRKTSVMSERVYRFPSPHPLSITASFYLKCICVHPHQSN